LKTKFLGFFPEALTFLLLFASRQKVKQNIIFAKGAPGAGFSQCIAGENTSNAGEQRMFKGLKRHQGHKGKHRT